MLIGRIDEGVNSITEMANKYVKLSNPIYRGRSAKNGEKGTSNVHFTPTNVQLKRTL